MLRKSKNLDLSVRSPTQQRSRNTVEAIIEAAARILRKDGVARLNTNLIAERAGTSIGTLYQYFPNKEAILVAIAQRQLAQDRACLMATISQALEENDCELDRIIIRKVIELHNQNPEMRRALKQNLIALGREDKITRTMQEIIAVLIERVAPTLPVHLQPISPTMIFILTHAVEGAIHAAAYSEEPLLDRGAVEDELVLLVRAYLRAAAEERDDDAMRMRKVAVKM